MELLTNSRLKDFRACQRLHFYRYVQGYRPARTSEALAFGTHAHVCLEAYWNARRYGEVALAAALEAMPRHLDPYVEARLFAMLVAYATRWDAVDVEVLAVEEEFRLPLLNPETGAASRTFQLAGKIDAIVRLPDGRVALIEHKTAGESPKVGSAYRDRLTLDGQVSQYFEGAAALGWSADLCVYDVLVKPALRPLEATPVELRKYTKPTKAEPTPRLYANQREDDETPAEYGQRVAAAIAESPDDYLAQIEVVRLEGERDEYRHDVWRLGVEMRDGASWVEAKAGRLPPKNPDACHRYGGTCAFLDVCKRAASLDDATRFVRLEDPHPELQAA